MQSILTNPYAITFGAISTAAIVFSMLGSKNKFAGQKPGTVYIFTLAPALGVECSSPFGVKLETWIRLVNKLYPNSIPFEKIITMEPGPRGKFPYIMLDGKVYADTALIIDFLKKRFSIKIDDELSDMDNAISNAFQRMLEEHLYFTLAYDRWLPENHWRIIKEAYFHSLPPIIRYLIPKFLIRPEMLKSLKLQGTGRFTLEEVYEKMRGDLKAVSVYLGEKKYFLGNKPHTIDAVIYGLVGGVLLTSLNSPAKEYGESLVNLKEYLKRMRSEVFSSN